MLVLEGTNLFEKGMKVGKLELQEGQTSERFIIVESCPGPLREVELTEAEKRHLNTLSESNGRPNAKVLLTLEGVFQRADTDNANNRVYPNSIWKKVLEKDSKWLKSVQSGDMLGEADHPKDGETLLSRVACMVTDLRRNESADKEILGRVVVFDTAKGRDLKAIHEGGGRLGVSSRGQGSVVRMDGKDVVQEDYDLQTWDVVYNPSTPGAYPSEVTEHCEKAAEDIFGKVLTEASPRKTRAMQTRPSELISILKIMTETKVNSKAPITESMRDIRNNYRAVVGAEGPLTETERTALTYYVEASYKGKASEGHGRYVAIINFGGTLTESISMVEIRATSLEELKKLVTERVGEVQTFVTVEMDSSEAIYQECADRFNPLLEAQLQKAQESIERETKARESVSEMSAKLSAAKQLIEKFASRTRDSEASLEESQRDILAAETLVEALAEEFYAEGLKAAVAAIAATHPGIDDLPEVLSRVSSLKEAVAVTKQMKESNAVFLEREPLGIRNRRVEDALRESRKKETSLIQETARASGGKETPALRTNKNVTEAMRGMGLK